MPVTGDALKRSFYLAVEEIVLAYLRDKLGREPTHLELVEGMNRLCTWEMQTELLQFQVERAKKRLGIPDKEKKCDKG
jgi:hypothetical protein